MNEYNENLKQLENFYANKNDKKTWGDGPWVDEPDKLFYEEDGYYCLILRALFTTGALCGYVALPKKHPLLKEALKTKKRCPYDLIPLEVHGGLTHMGERNRWLNTEEKRLVKGMVWIGFDCAHLYDTCPLMEKTMKMSSFIMPSLSFERFNKKNTYRDINFVKAEISSMIKQIKEYNEMIKKNAKEKINLK